MCVYVREMRGGRGAPRVLCIGARCYVLACIYMCVRVCVCVYMWRLPEDEGARVFWEQVGASFFLNNRGGRYIDLLFDLVYNGNIINLNKKGK